MTIRTFATRSFCLGVLGLTLLLPMQPLHAATSLRQIQYQLAKNPQAQVIPELRELAQQGQQQAMLMLAGRLANSISLHDVEEARQWYQRLYRSNPTNTTVLAELAQLEANRPARQRQDPAFLRWASAQFDYRENLENTIAALELTMAYPDLYQASQVDEMLGLYGRACHERCQWLFYSAEVLRQRGNAFEAKFFYEASMKINPRAIRPYLQLMGADSTQAFIDYSRKLQSGIPKMPLPIVVAIGSSLASLPKVAVADINVWLDNAISRGAVEAMVAKANYMLGRSWEFTEEPVVELIHAVESRSPLDAKRLWAQAHLVRTWRVLNPQRSYELIQELIAIGDRQAWMVMGELYSMGGLDEADQNAAVQSFSRLAEQGYSPAIFRIAQIYASGRSICHDKPRSLAYARLASRLDEPGAAELVANLSAELNQQQLDAAATIQTQLEARIF